MGAPGFWDDQERAAKTSAEHARATKKLELYAALERDVEDLEPLAEMADEDPELASELEEQIASVERRLEALELERLFSGRYDAGDALGDGQRRRGRHRRAGLGRDGAADGDALGREARLRGRAAGGERGGGGRHQVGDVPRQRRERLRPLRRREGRPPARAALARSTPPTAARRASPGVEVSPVVEDVGEIVIDDDDLQVDTYRASGAGGQHVNKTDSAVRITHKPSGIVVQCQNERSQTQNRLTAMGMLRSKLAELEERKRQEEIAKERGEAQDVNFGSQIRSYVLHPYTMVKDHRTNFEMGDANRVLDGDLDGFVRAELLRAAGR